MSLSKRIDHAAEQAAAGGSGPWSIEETEGAATLRCELIAVESLACAFTSFELRNSAWAAKPIADVKRIAEQLAKRLTYLLEPIQPIETDAEHCVVQMRSSPPRVGEHGSSYYELHVRRGGVLSLCRYEKQPGDVRRTVPVHVTREVFRHLVADFAAVG